MRHADTYVAYEDMTLTSNTASTTSCLLPYASYTKLTYALCLIPHRPQALLLQPRHGAANGGRSNRGTTLRLMPYTYLTLYAL